VPRRLAPLLAAVAAFLAVAPAAHAEVRKLSYRVGPIEVAPYQVRQNGVTIDIPKPDVDGAITAMDVDLVDGDGSRVPIKRLMLHHIVFTSLGATIGSKHDASCNEFTALDSTTTIPALAERFYAAGEERAELSLPEGYGYPVGGEDRWGLTWMVMNHRARTDRAYIRYRITYDTDAAALTPVKPVWLDVANCNMGPDLRRPGRPAEGLDGRADGRLGRAGVRPPRRRGRPRARRRARAAVVRAGLPGPHARRGRADLGHAQAPLLQRQAGAARARADPHARLRVADGLPFGAGQRVRLSSVYDAARPHTRVMGIAIAFIAPPAPEQPSCAPLPRDVIYDRRPAGRSTPPKVTVPLTGLDAKGRAIEIDGPPGRTARRGAKGDGPRQGLRVLAAEPLREARGDGPLELRGRRAARRHARLRPRGFSSPHGNDGATFEKRLKVPGTYRLYCSLHPVAMTERIVVRR
jgi:hypothetical protein